MRDAIRRTRHSRVISTIRRLRPRALTPRAPVFQRLSDTDREALEQLLAGPVECVYDASFRSCTLPGAELDASVAAQPAQRRESAGSAATVGPATEVLTADEERALFLRFNYCRYRVMRILHRYRGRRLDADATRELLHWHWLALEKRTQLVRWNTSLVLAMARRSRNAGGVELTELVSEGNLALLRCVDKFDAARGFKFSTYACRAILASFSRIAAKTARYRAQFPTPYDSAMDRSDYLDRKRERIELECVDELRRVLFENAAELNSVERRVLDARFALNQADRSRPGARRKTLDQVGALLGVSKERVRQIQNQAMGKLRAALERRMLAAS